MMMAAISATFFNMADYGGYIWASYGLSAIGLLVLTARTVCRYRRAKAAAHAAMPDRVR